uniref:C-type lectin domain-containing protein n=1 Tax=Panagrellus redivivus TaxID=6233 RepID=A0A7E4V9I4_PANRE
MARRNKPPAVHNNDTASLLKKINWTAVLIVLCTFGYCFYRASRPSCGYNNGWVSDYTRQCFIPIPQEMTFHDAEAYCKAKFVGHLASIHNDGDASALNHHIRMVFPSIKYYYIGLNKYACDNYMWQDNTDVNFKPPGFDMEDGSCAYIKSEDRRWFEGVCRHKKSFVCTKRADTVYDLVWKLYNRE